VTFKWLQLATESQKWPMQISDGISVICLARDQPDSSTCLIRQLNRDWRWKTSIGRWRWIEDEQAIFRLWRAAYFIVNSTLNQRVLSDFFYKSMIWKIVKCRLITLEWSPTNSMHMMWLYSIPAQPAIGCSDLLLLLLDRNMIWGKFRTMSTPDSNWNGLIYWE